MNDGNTVRTPPSHSEEPLQSAAQDSPKTSVTSALADLAALARQAFEEKRRKECLALTRAILKIDPDHREAQVMESWIRSDLKENLETARTVARDPNLQNSPSLYKRAETMVRAILDVDPDNEAARALLSEAGSSMAKSHSVISNDAPVPREVDPETAHAEALRSLEQRIISEGQYPSPLSENPGGFRSRGLIALCALAAIAVVWLVMRQHGVATVASPGVASRSTGILSVAVDEGVQVVVNDQYRGTAPMEPLTLAPGVYRLKYKINGEEIASEEVSVSAGGTAHNSMRHVMGRLMLIVLPTSGVQLSVDDKSIGPAPPYLEVKPGEHLLKFTAAGHESETRSASVKAGGNDLLTVLLKPSSGNSSPAGGRPVTETRKARVDAAARVPISLSSNAPPSPPSVAERVAAQPAPAATGTLAVESVTVQINARPWADVVVDGNPPRVLGQTPLGSVSVPVGSTLVFRNPNFPEKKYRVAAKDTAIQVVFP
jgi:hypothetical protein